jgi:chromosome partitioning protein
VLPASRKLLNIEGELWKSGDRATARRKLSERLGNITANYDFVILDFPPAASLISENGLLLINELIIPIPMNHLALVGAFQVIGTLKAISQIPDHNVRLTWILPTLFDERQRKDREILMALKRQFPNQVANPIRRNVRVAEAPAQQKTIFEYDPRCYGAADYAQLVERVADETPKKKNIQKVNRVQ